jgi:hypothetical protein
MQQQFEEHVRCLMATGASARAVREGLILHASHFLVESEAVVYTSEIPQLDWFNKQREALGLESYLYTFMRIAGCDKILQWGFDETFIDGHGLMNQWAMVVDSGTGDEEEYTGASIVTLKCAAVLPGSEAQEAVDHIEEVWACGKLAIDYLRDLLGPELRDTICPLKNGGVCLHKIYGVMHDTCNCANLVATLMMELRNRKCAEHYGADAWQHAGTQAQACFNFLCGNHTRNLPVVRFNKVPLYPNPYLTSDPLTPTISHSSLT